MTKAVTLPALAFAAALVAACTAHVARIETAPDGANVERIVYDPGGGVRKGTAKWAARQRRHGIDRYMIDGLCGSLCVHLVLAQAGTCYTPNASLWMHDARMLGLVETPATRRWTEWSVARWPAPWREWWQTHQPGPLGVHLSIHDLREIDPEGECPAEGES